MALDLHKYIADGKSDGANERLFCIDEQKYINFKNFFKILKNKTGTSFDLYSDCIIRNGNWDPWIDSIKESLQVDKNPQILEELSELLKIFEEAKYKGYGLVFYGD